MSANIKTKQKQWKQFDAVDLSSPLHTISMAGLNLSNPKTEPNHPLLLCQTCWSVALVRSGSYLKPEGVRPQPGPGAWGQKEGERGVEGSEAKWQSQCVDVGCYCGKYHRGAAELYVTEQGWEQRGVFVCERYSSEHVPHLLWFRNPK